MPLLNWHLAKQHHFTAKRVKEISV